MSFDDNDAPTTRRPAERLSPSRTSGSTAAMPAMKIPARISGRDCIRWPAIATKNPSAKTIT